MTQSGERPWGGEPTQAAPAAYPPAGQLVGYGPPVGYPPAGYGPAPARYGPTPAPSSSGAITVLVLGIVSIVSIALCPLVGLVPAIVALCMAGGAGREIEESRGQVSGLGMITAGRIMSWITIGLHALVTVAVVVLVVVVGAFNAA